MTQPIEDDEEFYVVPVADVPGLHSPESPFCSDPTCPCHLDMELIQDSLALVDEGLLTGAELIRTYQGRQI